MKWFKRQFPMNKRAESAAVVLLACVLVFVVGSLALVAYYYATGKI